VRPKRECTRYRDTTQGLRLGLNDGEEPSLLHAGGDVTRTVYDDRVPMSSRQWWPLPRGDAPPAAGPPPARRQVAFARCPQHATGSRRRTPGSGRAGRGATGPMGSRYESGTTACAPPRACRRAADGHLVWQQGGAAGGGARGRPSHRSRRAYASSASLCSVVWRHLLH